MSCYKRHRTDCTRRTICQLLAVSISSGLVLYARARLIGSIPILKCTCNSMGGKDKIELTGDGVRAPPRQAA